MADTIRKTADEANGVIKGAIDQASDSVVELSRKAQHAADKTIDKATHLAKDFAEDAGARTKKLAAYAKGATGETIERGKKVAHQGMDIFDDTVDAAKQGGKKAQRYAQHEMNSHPLATVALAAGIGALVSMMLVRKR